MALLQHISNRALKTVFVTLTLIPAGLMSWQLINGDLGAQPAEEMNHQLGQWALRLLALNLTWGSAIAVDLWPRSARRLVILRRHLGVVGFGYALGHLIFYVLKEGDLGLAVTQMFTKLYLVIGLVAFTILLILSATSTDRAVRALRQRWKTLHRLAYVAIVLSVVHFQLIEKKDWTEALPYLVPMLGLYLVRIGRLVWRRATPRPRPAR